MRQPRAPPAKKANMAFLLFSGRLNTRKRVTLCLLLDDGLTQFGFKKTFDPYTVKPLNERTGASDKRRLNK